MSTGIFSIGVSGLGAAQMGLLATEHNVVNANTPGYSRQRVVQATNISVNTGAGSLGQGVYVQTVERSYDRFLTAQVNSAQTTVSSLDAYYSQIKQIDTMLADSSAGLSPALQDFFLGVQKVASDPSSLPARQTMISSAQTMVNRFQTMDARLQELSNQVNGRISNTVAEINTYTGIIAELNSQIVISESAFGQPANDLQDQRDQVLLDLNKLVKVSSSTNSDGTFNVFMGNGQQLVIGGVSMNLTAEPSTSDLNKIVVGLKMVGGNQEFPESMIVGGELGGLVAFRQDSLDATANELGRVATSLAVTFNAQHALGQDMLENFNDATTPAFVGKFFTYSEPNVISNSKNAQPELGSMSATFAAPVAPKGPDYQGNFFTELTNSSYEVQFGAAGAYQVFRQSDNKVVASGSGPGTISFDGIKLNIASSGTNGDKFLIEPFAEASRNIGVNGQIAADPRLIAAASPMRVDPADNNKGSMKFSQGVVGFQEDGSLYDLSSLPELTATATDLTNVPSGWRAVYSDGYVDPPMSSSEGVATNVALTRGATTLSRLSFDGMSFEISGKPEVGDKFQIERNLGGVQDGRNALLFAKLQTQNTVADGKATFQSAYARLVADNGIRTREAKVQLDAQSSILDRATETRDSLSGVNLDEEAANMLRFQQAYQASSRILEIGGKLFDTILSIS